MPTVTVITPPAIEPVTLDELKTYLRIDGNDEDDLLEELITGARQLVELFTGRALISQGLSVAYDCVAGDDLIVNEAFALPRLPVISVDDIIITDVDGVTNTVPNTDYQVSTKTGQVIPLPSTRWPDRRQWSGLEVLFTAGYGVAASSVPALIKVAIRQAVSSFYECRSINKLPPGTLSLLRPYKLWLA